MWQVFSPAKVIFAGVGVLLSVRIILNIYRAANITALTGSSGCSKKPRYACRCL